MTDIVTARRSTPRQSAPRLANLSLPISLFPLWQRGQGGFKPISEVFNTLHVGKNTPQASFFKGGCLRGKFFKWLCCRNSGYKSYFYFLFYGPNPNIFTVWNVYITVVPSAFIASTHTLYSRFFCIVVSSHVPAILNPSV